MNINSTLTENKIHANKKRSLEKQKYRETNETNINHKLRSCGEIKVTESKAEQTHTRAMKKIRSLRNLLLVSHYNDTQHHCHRFEKFEDFFHFHRSRIDDTSLYMCR